MNAAAETIAAPTHATATTCFHCGESLAADRIDVDGHLYCCSGCAAAQRFIRDNGLDDYYRLRTQPGSRPTPTSLVAFDDPDILAHYSITTDQGHTIDVAVDGMHCAACAWLIGESLRRCSGVVDAHANFVAGRAHVVWSQDMSPLSTILGHIERLGYRVSLAGTAAQQSGRTRERRTQLLRIGIAGLATMQAMMFSEALYLDTAGEMAIATRDLFRWLTMLTASPVLLFAAWPFWRGAMNEWRLRRFGMDTLSSVSILLAFGASVFETLRGGPHVWFDAAVMFVFFLLLARSLEGAVRASAQARLDRLAAARPAMALRRDGAVVTSVPATHLIVGDVVQVAAGATVPADGVLDSEVARFDESLLTGEATPQLRRHGATILAGSVCLDVQAWIRVTAVGPNTRLSDIERTMIAAAATRPAVARWLDVLVLRFVVVILLLAAATAGVWWFVDATRVIPMTLAVLMASCPCALALAIPTALLAAQSRLTQSGLLCLDADALLSLREVDMAFLDKTGTLTEGAPRITNIITCRDLDADDCLRVARALELGVAHPIAAAFRGDTPWVAEQVDVFVGAGLSGRVNGRSWRLGSLAWVSQWINTDRLDCPAGSILLADELGVVACFELDDRVRDGAHELVQGLKHEGVSVSLLSGDHAAPVHAMANRLGITRFFAAQSPEHKRDVLASARSAGHKVLMLGDGINDAPVLAAADVGISLAKAAPLAQHAAGLIVLNGRLQSLLDALLLSRRLHWIIRQNLVWALGYNVVMLPLAAIGLIGPGLAALGMSLSSLTVTLNALRLTRS